MQGLFFRSSGWVWCFLQVADDEKKFFGLIIMCQKTIFFSNWSSWGQLIYLYILKKEENEKEIRQQQMCCRKLSRAKRCGPYLWVFCADCKVNNERDSKQIREIKADTYDMRKTGKLQRHAFKEQGRNSSVGNLTSVWEREDTSAVQGSMAILLGAMKKSGCSTKDYLERSQTAFYKLFTVWYWAYTRSMF